MACGLKTSAVERSIRVCFTWVSYGHDKHGNSRYWGKRFANRAFRHQFNQQLRQGLEAWSEFAPSPRAYYTTRDAC